VGGSWLLGIGYLERQPAADEKVADLLKNFPRGGVGEDNGGVGKAGMDIG